MEFGQVTIEDISKVVVADLKEELQLQGHYLSGELENSITTDIIIGTDTITIDGEAFHYAEYVDRGFPAQSASFKQFPFLYAYFTLRGLTPKNAKAAAAATIMKWMKESGMPTSTSYRFSKTNERLHVIDEAFNKNEGAYDLLFQTESEKEFDALISDTFGEINF